MNLEDFLRYELVRIRSALAEEGQQEVDAIRQDIGIPIEYGRGAPIRSLPGEPPRAGTTDQPLRDSVKSDTAVGDASVQLGVGAGPVMSPNSGRDYAVTLETGGPQDFNNGKVKEPRPFMGVSFRRFVSERLNRVWDRLRGSG